MNLSRAAAFAFLSALGGAGCEETEEMRSPQFWPTSDAIRAATQAEVTRLLMDGNLRELEGAVDARRPVFYSSGRYVQVGYATVEGYYTVDSNIFCMSVEKGDPSAYCRAINITPTGPVVVDVTIAVVK